MNNIYYEFSPEVARASARRDLWRTAIHEAGHAHMARKFKIKEVQAIIYRNPAGGRHQKFWTGQCRWISTKRPAARHTKLIGAAGLAAVCVWDTKQPDACVDLSCVLWDRDAMSPTDWLATGCEPGVLTPKLFRVVEEAMELISNGWSEVSDEAIDLIRLTRKDIEEEIQYCIKDKEFDKCDALRHDLAVIDDVLAQHA
jgi:hypothetical protein